MLKALKTASEAYVEASTSTAQIAIPFPASHAVFDIFHSTLKTLSAHMHSSTASLTSTGLLAGLYSYGIGPGQCFTSPSDPSRLFLTVEYTRSALTALVVFEDCCVYDVERVLHETELGADNLSKEPFSTHQVKLEKALSALTRLPLTVDGETMESFSDVLLLDELAGDPLLRDALKDVLGKHRQSDNLLAAAVDRLKGTIVPVFAGATSAVHRDLEQATNSALNPDNLCQAPV